MKTSNLIAALRAVIVFDKPQSVVWFLVEYKNSGVVFTIRTCLKINCFTFQCTTMFKLRKAILYQTSKQNMMKGGGVSVRAHLKARPELPVPDKSSVFGESEVQSTA